MDEAEMHPRRARFNLVHVDKDDTLPGTLAFLYQTFQSLKTIYIYMVYTKTQFGELS